MKIPATLKDKNTLWSVLVLACVWVLSLVSPQAPLDPWNLISPKKIAMMIFALTFLQVVGAALFQIGGMKTGALLSGFLGGLISSTATTAALARRSVTSTQESAATLSLSYLAATAAMLVEAIALTATGTSVIHFSLFIIFFGPLLTTAVLIFRHFRELTPLSTAFEKSKFSFFSILKLVAFIVCILVLSKFLQGILGKQGLVVLTFLVSLFEIHGSVIANVQLHELEILNVSQLGGLLAISIAASYLSKLFLIYTIGSAALRTQITKSTALIIFSLLASWLISIPLGKI